MSDAMRRTSGTKEKNTKEKKERKNQKILSPTESRDKLAIWKEEAGKQKHAEAEQREATVPGVDWPKPKVKFCVGHFGILRGPSGSKQDHGERTEKKKKKSKNMSHK